MDRASNPVPIVREVADLKALAAAINAATEAGDEATSKGLDYYREAGEKLLKAKQACGHGNWQQWCKQNVHCSIRQARRYMALAKCDGSADLADQWRVILNGDEQPEEAEAKTAVNGRFESPKEETVKAKSQPKSEPAGPGTRPPVATGERQPGDDDPGAAGATTPTAPEPKSPGGAEAVAEPVETPSAPAPPLLDEMGVPVPEALRPVWDRVPQFDEILSHLEKAQRLVSELAKSPAGLFLRGEMRSEKGSSADGVKLRDPDLHNSIRRMKTMRPFSSHCPYCLPKADPNCRACKGAGWVVEDAFRSCPRDYVAAIEALRVA